MLVRKKKQTINSSGVKTTTMSKSKYIPFKDRNFRCFGNTYGLNRLEKYDCNKMVDIYPLNICKTVDEYQNNITLWKGLLKKDCYAYFIAPNSIKEDVEVVRMVATEDFWTLRAYPKRETGLENFVESVLLNKNNEKHLNIKEMSPYNKEKICNIMERILNFDSDFEMKKTEEKVTLVNDVANSESLDKYSTLVVNMENSSSHEIEIVNDLELVKHD